jgi:hypothetical protein
VKIKRFPPCKWRIRLDYYYDNVNDKGFSFETMCHMIRSHFEPEEHKRGMMTKWNSTTLKTIMAKIEERNVLKCSSRNYNLVSMHASNLHKHSKVCSDLHSSIMACKKYDNIEFDESKAGVINV